MIQSAIPVSGSPGTATQAGVIVAARVEAGSPSVDPEYALCVEPERGSGRRPQASGIERACSQCDVPLFSELSGGP